MFSGLYDLVRLYLFDNELHTIEPKSFENKTALTHLLLGNNLLETLPDDVFAGLSSVTSLELHNNRLSVVRKPLFSGLYNLETLTLHGNQIHTVQPASLENKTALWYLSLKQNWLENLPESMFDSVNHPTALSYLYVEDNPLSCDRCLAWLMRADGGWLTVKNADSVTCTGPPGLTGRTWDTITDQEFTSDTPGKYFRILYYNYTVRIPLNLCY